MSYPDDAPQFTRPALAARVATLRQALGLLAVQADRDRGGCYRCVGAMKKERIRLEGELRAMDRREAGVA